MSFLPPVGGPGFNNARLPGPANNFANAFANSFTPGPSSNAVGFAAARQPSPLRPLFNVSDPDPGPGPGHGGPSGPGGPGGVLPYSPGGAQFHGPGAGPGMGPGMGPGPGPGAGPGMGQTNFNGGAGPGFGYDGGPSPNPTYPDVGRGLVRRAGPFGNQIGVGTLGDFLFHAAGGDRALNRNELMQTLGVSSPIADTLINRLGNGTAVPVEALIDVFRPYTFDGIHISDQGIDMALREAMGPVEANFFSFADPNGNLSMAGFAAIAREAMHFLGMPQPNPALLSSAFRRLAGMDGLVDIGEAGAVLGIGPDGSFSLGDAGMAIMNLLNTAPTPGGFSPGWGPPIAGPAPYIPGPRHPFGPSMPFSPGPAMGPGQFHWMVNQASQWTGQFFHPAQIDAAYRNIGGRDGFPGVSPWEFGSAFGSMNPSPWQVTSAVNAFSWPPRPFWGW